MSQILIFLIWYELLRNTCTDYEIINMFTRIIDTIPDHDKNFTQFTLGQIIYNIKNPHPPHRIYSKQETLESIKFNKSYCYLDFTNITLRQVYGLERNGVPFIHKGENYLWQVGFTEYPHYSV